MSTTLTPAEVAKETRHSRDSVARWIGTGVLVGGVRVKLRASRVGGRWFVDREDLERFISACSGDARRTEVEPEETPTQRARRIAKAKAACFAMLGIEE